MATTIYVINKTDGSQAFAIQPNTFDGIGGIQTNSDLTLYGNATPNWGEKFNENFYNLLENFSVEQDTPFVSTNTTPPIPLTRDILGATGRTGINNPVQGQLWYNQTDKKLYVYAGTSWKGTATASTTQTTDPIEGDFWFDGTTNLLNVWNGTGWIATALGSSFVQLTGDTMTGVLQFGSHLFLDEGAGSTAVGPDMRATGDLLLSANSSIQMHVDDDNNGGGAFRINKGSSTSAGITSLFGVENNGSIRSFISNYETLVTLDDSIPNKKYVDDLADNYVLTSGDTMTGVLHVDAFATGGVGGSSVPGEGVFGIFVDTSAGTDAGGILLRVGDNNGDEHAIEVVNHLGAQIFSLRATTGSMFVYGQTTHQAGSRLFLNVDPTSALEAATRQYVDNNAGVATGYVLPFAVNSTPTGFLKCNGSAVSRTTYATLFAVVGTTYGVGNGSTTFNLPDLRGEFLRGWDDGKGTDSGRVIGSFQNHEFLSHTHEGQTGFHGNPYYPIFDPRVGFGGGTPDDSTYKYNTSASGGSETRPRNVAMLYCIKF